VGRLVIEAEGLNWRNHRATASASDEVRLLAYLTRQRSRERMLKQLENPLRIARQ
jgi:hypothetical protein